MITLPLFLFLSPVTFGQQKISSFLLKPPLLSSHLLSSIDSLTSQRGEKGLVPVVKEKSPTLAVALSTVMPGAGQIYVGRYWTIPLIWGFGGYFAAVWVRQNDRYQSARDRYEESVRKGENNGQGNDQIKYERDFYRDQRDKFAFYFALTYLLNIVDAYVGASLYGFDVSDDLGGNVSAKLRIPFR